MTTSSYTSTRKGRQRRRSGAPSPTASFLSLSILPHLLVQILPMPEGMVMGINYGAEKVRFSQPVKVNSRVRARATIEQVNARPGGQYMVKTRVTLEVENNRRPAVIAHLLSLYVVEPS